MSQLREDRVDTSDLASIFRQNHDFVWRTLYHFGLPRAAIDDAVQDVFLVVHRRLPDFDPRGSIRNWLYGIARRVASEHRRGATRSARRLELVPDPDTHAGKEREALRAEAADEVRHFLDTLDAQKREVFLLSAVEGMTAFEIAEVLGVKVDTVYGRIRAVRTRFDRAMQRLRARREREHRSCS